MPKTWKQKFEDSPPPHVAVMSKALWGLCPGDRLAISSPREIAELVSAIPFGSAMTVSELRAAIAQRHNAEGACPLTTSIFLRIVAERTAETGWEVPVWRVIDEKSPLLKKLTFGPEPIIERRRAERL